MTPFARTSRLRENHLLPLSPCACGQGDANACRGRMGIWSLSMIRHKLFIYNMLNDSFPITGRY